jgi:hypothetical protein
MVLGGDMGTVVDFLLVAGGVMGLLWLMGLSFVVMGLEHLGLWLLLELGIRVGGSGFTFITVFLFLKIGLTKRGVAKWLKEPVLV